MQSAMSQENARDAASGDSWVVNFLMSPVLSANVTENWQLELVAYTALQDLEAAMTYRQCPCMLMPWFKLKGGAHHPLQA